MAWKISYTESAEKDFQALDGTQKKQVAKAMLKVSENPLPASEGGYGKPLGNKGGSNLTGYFKIKLLKLGLRVVYRLIRTDETMEIIIISIRDDESVYKEAVNRIKRFLESNE